jgi:hypothetical protein
MYTALQTKQKQLHCILLVRDNFSAQKMRQITLTTAVDKLAD